MPERRRSERRTNPAVEEPLERKRERRQGDRRESLRKAARVVVRAGRRSEEVSGEVGLGGASFTSSGPMSGAVTLELKAGWRTLTLPATVLAARAARTAVRHVQVRFAELDTDTELALARWLDDVE